MSNKLPTPTGLSASYTESATTLSWNAVPAADFYVILKNGATVTTTASTSYSDNSARYGTSFTYGVIASQYDTALYPNTTVYPATTLYPGAGRLVDDSDPAIITTHNPQKLPTPTITRTSQTATSATIYWASVARATVYSVQWGSNGDTTTDTSYEITGLRPNTSMLVMVSANAPGYYASDPAIARITILPRQLTPTIAISSQTASTVVLNINRLQSTGTMVLLRNGQIIGTYSSTGSNTWSYTDTGLINTQSYVYSVYTRGDSSHNDSLYASVTVFVDWQYGNVERQIAYLQTLKTPFVKLCRLRFLYPNGVTAYVLDNNPRNRRSKAFVADGTVNANMQNGQRLSASVTIANANHLYDFAFNAVWFGQQIALDEGLVLPNGEEYWHQTGVFVIDNPQETINPNTRTVTYNLVDKWADLDGTLDGNLEGTYEVPVNTNIYTPIAALLNEDKGNGYKVDFVAPVFTEYFNAKTQELPDGTTASMVLSPYTLTVDGDGGTIGAVVLGLGGMVNAWVGYDNTGRLRIEPSQDDILDAQKAVLYRFSPEEITLLGLAYTIKKEDVYNDYIVVGEQMDDYSQPGGRAQNLDPRSDTNVNTIGRKTKRESSSGYATIQQCKDLAEWRLKRSGVLQKAVNISCSQMFHIELNTLVEIVRTDKQGSPTERHLIQGYSRPLASNGAMTISCVSVNDLPIATVTQWPEPD